MRQHEYTEIICKGFCGFYKPGKKEDTACGTYEFLKKNLSPGELLKIAESAGFPPEYSSDGLIKSLTCGSCGFFKDGCDYRKGLKSAPCGGYNLIENLLQNHFFFLK
jgi:hypothetical protein